MKALLLLPLLAGCWLAKLTKDPEPPIVPMAVVHPAADSVWLQHVRAAAGYAAGTITNVQADWAYDDPCTLIIKATRNCTGTVTYRLEVDGKRLHVFVPPYGQMPLAVGMSGVFIYTRVYAVRYLQCREQAGAAGSQCQTDPLDVILTNDMVLPLEDQAWVQSLRRW